MVKEDKVEESESVATDEVADILLDEATKGYREWELDDKKYRTRFPNAEEDSKAGWAYSRAFNEALKEGLPTRKEMEKILRKREIITDDDDKALDKKRDEIAKAEEMLAKKKVGDDSLHTRKLVSELMMNRAELMESINEVQSYMQNTVEYKGDEAKSAYLIASCTTDANGKRVWPTLNEFLTDTNQRLVNTATYEFTTFSMGVYENYFDILPEVQFLRAGKPDEDSK
jgi:hypothetical protein